MGKKIINQPYDCVTEATAGFLCAHGDRYEQVPDVAGLKVKVVGDKVALVIGGGSGHEPIYSYFIGENLADAAAIGNIFASPDPNTVYQTAKSVENGKGVLFAYGNYAGDCLNFDMAAELLEDDGIPSKTVYLSDDIASSNIPTERRGIAGAFLAVKIAGGATAAGLDLDEAYRVVEKANRSIASLGVALSGATIPGEDSPIFTLPDDEIEFGLGIHGEPGIKRMKHSTADEITSYLTERLISGAGLVAGDKVVTYVNGLGSSTLLELYIMNRKLSELLADAGIVCHDMVVDSFVTSQEMAGASISIMKLDAELQGYYDMPCQSAHYTNC